MVRDMASQRSSYLLIIGNCIEVSGIDAHTRLRLGMIVGLLETATPILGLQLGRSVAGTLSHAAHSIGVASEGARW